MDRTADFVSFSSSSGSRLSALTRTRCTSPFVLKASKILERLASFEQLLSQLYVDYVHDRRRMSWRGSSGASSSSTRMSESDRKEFDQEITLFIAAVASELNDLKYMLGASTSEVTVDLTWLQSLAPSSRAHDQEIVAFVSTKVSAFMKQVHFMNKERKRLSIDPLRLHSTDYDVYGGGEESDDNLLADTAAPRGRFSSLFDRNDTKASARPSKFKLDIKSSASMQVSKSFVAKYEREAGPPSKLRLYDSLASKHKTVLMREASNMQVKFSEGLQNATSMERTVNQIGELLTEFATILQSQSGQVEEVNDDAKQTEEHVKSSKSQLQLTIERSEKNQKSIVLLSVGLALLLLLLDWIER